MNFDKSFIPPSEWDLAFPAVTAFMGLLIVGGMLIARRVDWL